MNAHAHAHENSVTRLRNHVERETSDLDLGELLTRVANVARARYVGSFIELIVDPSGPSDKDRGACVRLALGGSRLDTPCGVAGGVDGAAIRGALIDLLCQIAIEEAGGAAALLANDRTQAQEEEPAP